jgi:Ca2+:H+ antiporter
MNCVFVDVVMVAVVDDAAGHVSAVQMALQNKLEVSVKIAVSSSTQIALFMAPVLVWASLLMKQPLDLHFRPLDVVAVVLSVDVVSLFSHDGEANWLEGAMLLALYAMRALAFYNVPPGAA